VDTAIYHLVVQQIKARLN